MGATPWPSRGAWPTSTASAPGEIFWAASDVGWVVGHSYIVYAPLLRGARRCSTRASRSARPTPGAFWRVVADHGVQALFTAPTAIRAIKKEDPTGEHGGRLRHLVACGRCSWPASGWTRTPTTGPRALLGVPVIDHWWQTETGWPIAANCLGIEPLPVKAGSPTKPVPGYDVRILDERRRPVPPGVEGAVVHPAAAAARHAPDAVRGRRALRPLLPGPLSRATT